MPLEHKMHVNEGLKAGDLEGVIDKRFSVDQYKSKMGDDRNIMVLAFTVDGLEPAKDLERFAETGYKEVLDADATPGTVSGGKHRVFIEFARVETVDQHITKFLEDLKKLTNIETFEFTYHKRTVPFEASSKSSATQRSIFCWRTEDRSALLCYPKSSLKNPSRKQSNQKTKY